MANPIYINEDDEKKELVYESVSLTSAQGTWDAMIGTTALAMTLSSSTFDIPPSANPAKKYIIDFALSLSFAMYYTAGALYNIYAARVVRISSPAAQSWNIDGYPMPQSWLGPNYSFERSSNAIRTISIPALSALATFDVGFFSGMTMNTVYASGTNYLFGYLNTKVTVIK